MPIFHDLYEDRPPEPSAGILGANDHAGTRYPHQDLIADQLSHLSPGHAMEPVSRPDLGPVTFANSHRPSLLSRAELIERIKRGNTPSWTPPPQNNAKYVERGAEPRPASRDRSVTPLHAAAEVKKSRTASPEPLLDNASAGIEIERPRSALHSGDFREKKEDASSNYGNAPLSPALATSPVAPWHQSFPAAAYPSTRGAPQFSLRDALNYESRSSNRLRATSHSALSSSFVLMPPTSPLVQQSNNTDLDFSSRPASRHSSRSPERNNRRHTFSPHSFQTFRSMQLSRSVSGTPVKQQSNREATSPYQAHQPRRSLNSFNQMQPRSIPQTPLIHSRRPSFSEASPLHHAPMVGSYEESILRGRMSTTPSRPLNFVAQIGVLGKGQCKANLKCPPHAIVPFPAVFYSYNSGNGLLSDNSPSPYVGLIDIENSLAAADDKDDGSRRRRRQAVQPDQDDVGIPSALKDERAHHLSKGELRLREKKKRRSTSPKAPPGGSYRIPQQGQLQIVIKNPNKTAVKLFLVPYDLSDMEPGQKTFIRQRSYSAGPIIEMPLSARKNLGTDRPEAALSNSDDPSDRPVLRYLIHLHICCPSKGRYYLYKGVRVVFANRVPDGKEKLRNEIQLPEPRYSTYKANRDSLTPHTTTSSAAAKLNSEIGLRRRSAGFPLTDQAYDRIDGLNARPPLPPPAIQLSGGYAGPSYFSSPMCSMRPVPFNISPVSAVDSRSASGDFMDLDVGSPLGEKDGSSDREELGLRNPLGGRSGSFEKLSKGDIGYGGNAFTGGGGGSGGGVLVAGLLARKLKGLDVKKDGEGER